MGRLGMPQVNRGVFPCTTGFPRGFFRFLLLETSSRIFVGGDLGGGEYRIFVVGKIYMCIIVALFWSLSCHPHHWLSLATCYPLSFFKNPQGTLTCRSLKRVVRFKGWSFATCFGMLPVNLGSLSWSGRARGGYLNLSVRRLPKYPQKQKKVPKTWAKSEWNYHFPAKCMEGTWFSPIWTIDGLMGCWFPGLTAFDSAPEK